MSARATAMLLDPSRRLLLTASTGADEIAVPAYQEWRKRVDFNDVGSESHRVMVTLVELATRNGLADNDVNRMRGVHRHVWTGNTLRLRHLFAVLDALAKADIHPFLMKGGALLARFPELAARRPTSDYDIVVRPADIPKAAELLAEAGYHPLALAWGSLVRDLGSMDTSGTAIAFDARDARVDFHWRPLGIIPDPELTTRMFEGAERRQLQGREVLVPSPAHQLFLCIARSDPSDTGENFRRLLEADMLLNGLGPDAVDWPELQRLVGRYGMEATAAAFFEHLRTDAGTPLPEGLPEAFAAATSFGGRLEAWARKREVPSRAPLISWLILQRAKKFGRAEPQLADIGLAEAAWRNLPTFLPGRVNRIRRYMIDRHAGPSQGRRMFIEGWYYSEPQGRWSNGRLAALRVPLTDAQRQGEPLQLDVRVMPGRWGARLVASGGLWEKRRYASRRRQWFVLKLRVKPEPALGGDGMIVFWVPDAARPSDLDKSPDTRLLGLFFRTSPAPA